MAIAEAELGSEVMLMPVPDLVPASPVYDVFLQAESRAVRLTVSAGTLCPDFVVASLPKGGQTKNHLRIPVTGARRIITQITDEPDAEWRVVSQQASPDQTSLVTSGFIISSLSTAGRLKHVAGRLGELSDQMRRDHRRVSLAIVGAGEYARLRAAMDAHTAAGRLFISVMDRLTEQEGRLGQDFNFVTNWFRRPGATDRDRRYWAELSPPPVLAVMAAEPGQ
jgi:hypothetical protein